MENEYELDELLQSYKLQDASDELLERIISRAADSKVLTFGKKPGYPFMLRNAAMAAAVAVLGFFCGSGTLATSETVASVQQPAVSSTLIDKAIIGTKTYSEINL